MRKNKYLITSAAVLALMSIGVPNVLAEEPSVVAASEESKSAELKYVVDEVYEWNIHSGIDFGKNKGVSQSVSVKSNVVSVTKNVLAEGSKLVIKVKGSGADNGFSINNGGGEVLSYSINDGTKDLSVNDTVLEVASGTNEGNKALEFKLSTANKKAEIAGSYNGTVTYTAEINGGDSGGTEISGVATGTKLTIEGKEYTVIENEEGTKYKVLANELADNGSPMRFGDNSNYATSIIATYLDNDYYNSLPESVKNAIVETTIQQKVLKTWAGNNPTDWDTPRDGGKHKVFLPSWDEVKTAAGSANKTALRKLLNSDTVWLRDTYDSNVLNVLGMGYLNHNDPNINSVCVRPAFVLDLSNVDYTKK